MPVYMDLCTRYSAPERAYHNLSHIENCLAELEGAEGLPSDLDAIRFALWFHDAVYDTTSKDNEEKSAVLACDVARSAMLPDSWIEAVTGLILATKHTVPPAGASQQLLVDVDLSILGQDEERFDEYESQIRAEYSWVSAEAFAKGRAEILSSLLARRRLYSTESFRRKFEEKARTNLSRSIAKLASA